MAEKNSDAKIPDSVYRIIAGSLSKIRYGSVTLVIQDGKVVQVESVEKIRTTEKN